MARAKWYVVQVQAGREKAMCKAIERACADVEYDGTTLLQECFTPTFVRRLKFKGEWQDVEERLLPGYVIAVTNDPVRVARRLYGVHEFSRLLKMNEAFVPLREEERDWIEESTQVGNRSVPISIGYRKGDTLVVTDGPLKGHEAMITRIVRKKCVAVIEIHAGNTRIVTEVGFALLPQKEAERMA